MQGADIETPGVEPMQVECAGSGTPIVLVGGGLTGWASWQPHAERLAATRAVARLQLLSVQYGLENRPLPDGYAVRLESRALAAALDSIGWDRPVDLVAWSFGALVTLDFALDQPARVRTLTLIEPPALWLLPGHGRDMDDGRALETLPSQDDDITIAALESFLRLAALVPPDTRPQSLPQWESWVRHRRSLRNSHAPLQHDDDIARVRAFEPPVLLVTGHGTAPFLRAVHDTLAATFPDVRTLELPGAHAPQLAAMDDFLAHLAALHAQSDGAAGGAPRHAMQTVSSRDGTRIAFRRSGSGPPLLLVHGATADHMTAWRLVLADLEKQFTVYAMDRRGRGASGDASEYALQREAEDVAAVAESIGEKVSVLGHSFGALAALEAALLTSKLHRLILYEGVPLRGEDECPPAQIARLEALLQAGDVEAVLVAMYRDIVGMPPDELEIMRAQREAWARRLANVPTLPRELRAVQRYAFAPERFERMRTPTLLLLGQQSPRRDRESTGAVAAALPDARVVELTGQQHVAMHTAPELFVREVVAFLLPGAGADPSADRITRG